MTLALALTAQDFKDQIFLTEDEALKLAFPECTFDERTLDLKDAKKNVEKEIARSIDPALRAWVATGKGKVQGFAAIVEEIGKYKPITFLVATNTDGSVRDILVLVYREPIGSEVKGRMFLNQFKGKNTTNTLKVGVDVTKIGGATLSCQAITAGVKRVCTIMKYTLCKNQGMGRQSTNEQKTIMRQIFGTLCSITAYAETEKKAVDAIERAFAELKRVDSFLSDYNEASELSKLNASAGTDFKVSADLMNFLKESKKYFESSGGAFDPTVGPIMDLWGFRNKGKEPKMPSQSEIQGALKCVGFDKIKIEEAKMTVNIPKGMRLDPGAIGKGLAADLAADVLKKEGIKSALIDLGSSTILAVGAPPGNGGWLVSVGRKDLKLYTLLLKDACLSTSGSYEKTVRINGKEYTHIMDPKSGMPVEGVMQVSIIAPTGTASDALSTAVFVLGLEKGKPLAEKCSADFTFFPDVVSQPVETAGWKNYLTPEK